MRATFEPENLMNAWGLGLFLLQVMVATGGESAGFVPLRRGPGHRWPGPSPPAAGVPALCRSPRTLPGLCASADGGRGSRKKVAIIGAGNVGGTTAFCLAQQGIADILLMDIDEGVAKGKALDIAQSLGVGSASCSVSGSCSYGDVSGADVVVVTCGLARRPGMSRDDLVGLNAGIVSQAAAGIKLHAPDAFVVMVTNPLDVMTYHFLKETGFRPDKVIGMAGELDSARLEHFIAQAVGCSKEDVHAMVLGGHGDAMIPLLSTASVNGIPVADLLSSEQLAAIATRTADGGRTRMKSAC
jgi:malate dehydrogenase